ncbi:MAG: discoidin domain-containing protein, partial [Planctomycetota bacterium]
KTNTLTLRIDNGPIVPIGDIGHAYTPITQTVWNGVIGDLTLEALPKHRIEHVRVVAKPNGQIAASVEGRFAPSQRLEAVVIEKGVKKPPVAVAAKDVESANKPVQLTGRYEDASPWSERSRNLYTLVVRLLSDEGEVLDQREETFGFRTFEAVGEHLEVNGKRAFLRGNLECAIFPQTGHPDADGEQWRKIMRVTRDHGLNHLRFHSWCPPRAAFEAADEAGVYLQVELPNWTFKMGQVPAVDDFLLAEGKRLLREYANHPSFVMFSLGNELGGRLDAMDRLLEELRIAEPELLYTSTSYAFSPRGQVPGPADDFFISQQTESGWVRGQGFLNSTFPTTDSDYAEGASSIDIPLVTHEVGQYVVYPDLSTLPKYDATPLRPTAMEAIRDDLQSKGMLADAERFTRDSGKLAALLYKEDIERALRTKDLAGIQLLQLQDFPGQSTATVGLLDAFWDSKGVITADKFREFSSPIVPLARFEKFVWHADEKFAAAIELANFSEATIEARFDVSLVDQSDNVIGSTRLDSKTFDIGNGLAVGTFEADLASIEEATRLELVVTSPDCVARNQWPIWVYPTDPAEPEVVIHPAADEACLADLRAGRSVLLLPSAGAVRRPIPARFIPVFWSPLHFPNQPGTLGVTIDADHPLWRAFPTDTHTNWQWWELLAESTSVDLTGFDTAIAKPFRFIDKYDRNALPAAMFEARVGPGRLLVCTLDVTSDPDERIVARQLLTALKRYVASSDFRPEGNLTPDELGSLFKPSRLVTSASDSHPDYPAANAIDGDPTTIWHTDWRKPGSAEPKTLQLDLRTDAELVGLRLQNRRGQRNGRLREAVIETSLDGRSWTAQEKAATLPDSGEPTVFRFRKPTTARYLRLVAKSTHAGESMASLAEIEPLIRGESGEDVRELGLIEGFND